MQGDFRHPTDQALTDKIYGSPLVQKGINKIFEEHLDQINEYTYSASYARLPKDHPASKYLEEGARRFGLDNMPLLYCCRSYLYDVTCSGYQTPLVVVPDVLIKNADEALLRGRMMAIAASIRMEHHKLNFLLWLLENFQGLIPIPFATQAIKTLFYEWMRAQQYSVDRAFLLATGDYPLALKNILYGELPNGVLSHFTFSEEGTFDKQVKDFYSHQNAVDLASSVYSVLQCESWLPQRYQELKRFHRSIIKKGGLM